MEATLQKHAKLNKLFAAIVTAIAFFTYLSTVSPTVAFWDCGEYIGAAHSLGIPHPPGNPLYVLLGRVFSILFFMFSEVAYRVNLISVISGSVTVMLMYLIIVRVTITWLGVPDTQQKRITTYAGAVVGALFCGFGYTFWFSAVEASVYIPSMMFVALSTWIALRWYSAEGPARDRWLLFAVYLTFLGIGMHMMSMLALAPLFLFVLYVDEQKRRDWRFILTAFLMGSVIYKIGWFIFPLAPALFLFTAIMAFVPGAAQKKWQFCFGVVFFALLGYSVHLYIPIRSALHPMIDENHPATFEAFIHFLERRQYGSENMLLRMFHRRGALTTQFGFDDHMGYLGFHLTQFFRFSGLDTFREFTQLPFMTKFSRLIIYMIPTVFMLFGWSYLYKRSRKVALLLIVLILGTTVGLVLFMNFADGTRAERMDYLRWVQAGQPGEMPTVHREVRIRDYFFTTGFAFLGMWIGIASTCALHALYSSKNNLMRRMAPVAAVLFLASPALPFSQNYELHNRSGDWIPYDYAYNLLMSCEKDGILFTNGDNDTFPLWFLQEAAGIRRDVRVVNLSLLNTKWYIKQLKQFEPKVPISFTMEEIDRIDHQANPFQTDTRYEMKKAGITVMLPGADKLPALRVQDKMVINIIESTQWKKPIYFAVTVADVNKMGTGPYLQMQGLVYRIYPQEVPEAAQFDLDRTMYMLDNLFQFRGLGDGRKRISETTHKLMSNYAACFIQTAFALNDQITILDEQSKQIVTDTTVEQRLLADRLLSIQNTKDAHVEKLINLLDRCVAIMPWDWRVRSLRHQYLVEYDRTEEAIKRMEEAVQIDPDNVRYLKMQAQLLQGTENTEQMKQVLDKLIELDPQPLAAYMMRASRYEDEKHYDSAIELWKSYQSRFPADSRIKSFIDKLEQQKQEALLPTQSPALQPQQKDTSGVVVDTNQG